MKVIEATNVRDAYVKGLDYLQAVGLRERSRAGDVLVSPVPVTTIYEKPMQRVLLDPQRDANPTFHLLESMWMLAGRNDAAFLNRYVKTFGDQFGEMDGTIHDAYGHRWREHFGFDQLAVIIDRLQFNRGDRQCVLQMWDAADTEDSSGSIMEHAGANDLLGAWRTRPCLAGDTVLWSPEGDMSISDVAAKFASGEVTRWPVYSVSGTKMKILWASDVWKSGHKKTVKITFDDGSVISCTPDHRFFRYASRISNNVREAEAGSLKPGDRVQARARKWDRKGYELFGRQVHLQYSEMLYGEKGGNVVHHADENKKNNRSENISYMSESAHNALHRMGDLNPMRRLTPEQHAVRATKQSASIRAYWNSRTPEEKALHSAKIVASHTPERLARMVERSTGKRHTPESRARMSQIKKQYWSDRTPEEKALHSEKCIASNTPERLARKAEKATGKRHTPETRARMSEIKKQHWEEKRHAQSNHVVVSVEEYIEQDVYDFTVPGFHTAVIGTGVVTHNCNTQAFFRLRDVTYREPPVTRANTAEWETRIVNGTNCVLDMTILARSNDMIFGGYGANAVHFSMMQEYVARMIGCAVGRMYQVSNNFHAYVEMLRKVLPIDHANLDAPYGGATVPLIDVKHTFDDELRWVLGQIDQGNLAGVLRPDVSFIKNRFLSNTVVPMAHAYEIWSQGTKAGKSTETGNAYRVLAYNMLKDVMAPDWRRAAMEWMERRLVGNQSA